jgi:hypothetical protein
MLDAHPNIWGLGEGSIFNHGLSNFREQLLSPGANVGEVITQYAVNVSTQMLSAARVHIERSSSNKNIENVTRVVDKMLFNYRIIGTITLNKFSNFKLD